MCHGIAAVAAWMLQRSAPSADAAGGADAGASDASESDAADAAAAAGTAASDVGIVAAAVAVGRPNALQEVREGFMWLFSRPDLRGVLFVATIINLGFSTALACVIYALQQAGQSTITIGLLSTGAGIAMLAGALIAPALVARIRAGVVIIGGLAVSTVGVSGMILVHDPLPLAIVLGVTVFFIPAVNAALGGYFMVATPTELLGRANSASAVLGMGALPVAPLIAGFGLAWIGRDGTLVTASALCLVSVLLAAATAGLRALPAESGWAAHASRFA